MVSEAKLGRRVDCCLSLLIAVYVQMDGIAATLINSHTATGGQLAYRTRLVTLSLSDEDFGKLVGGKTQAQRLFMSGKLKVKGDVMKATKMEPILKKAQTKAKL